MEDERDNSGFDDNLSTLSSERDPDRFRHLLEHIQDAVVEFELVDGEPVVRGVNASFSETFGYDAEAVVGASLNDFLVPSWLREEAAELDRRTGAGRVNYRLVRRKTADGLGEFLYRGIPTDDDEKFGFAVYTDLTEGRRKERRLEVLNRLLRHNLRNRVNVVSGYAESIRADYSDPKTADKLDRLTAAAEGLNGLVSEAGEIHRTLNATVPKDARVDCVPILEARAAAFRETYPHARIRTRTPSSLHVAATERLTAAVDCLLENAVVHNPSDRPRVWVEADRVPGGEWADVVVADDGPPIPAMERETVTGEAPITQTNHGGGLGLWLVKWTVERFGGVLSFGRSAAGGNRVQLRLRLVEADTDPGFVFETAGDAATDAADSEVTGESDPDSDAES